MIETAQFCHQAGTVPKNYRCSKCVRGNRKLWREYNVTHTDLLCYSCVREKEGDKFSPELSSCGWYVAAVPHRDIKEGWYGYQHVPEHAADWWYELPTV